jgi:hypothetical protein
MWRSSLAVLLLSTLTAVQAAPEVQPGFSLHIVDAILGPPHSGKASRFPIRAIRVTPESAGAARKMSVYC